MQLVDSHVHINFDLFQPDLEEVALRWREAGVVRLVHSCVEPGEFPSIQALADRFPELFFAVGLHPLDVADRWTNDSVSKISTLASSDTRVVAIGETGLDFYKAGNWEQQKQAFEAQLAIARQINLPVIIHCRDAAAPMAALMHQFWQKEGAVQGVMHCWGGIPEEVQWFLDLGMYISFSGTVTFKNAVPIQEAATIVPSDRLLIETDCPFLSPVPKRGQRRNEPANVQYVAEQIARLRGIPVEQLAAQAARNACELFRLPALEPD
jgi:TatD DNase family protein